MSAQQINLYHPIFRREQKLFSAATMARTWLALLAVGLAAAGFDAWQVQGLASALANARQTEQAAHAQLASAKRIFGVGRARAQLAALEAHERALKGLARFLRESRRAEVGPAPVLLAMSDAIVPGVWITHFSLDRKRHALILAGHSMRPAQVPLFLHRLVARPTLIGYRFQTFAITRPRHAAHYRPYVDFTASTAASGSAAPKKPEALRSAKGAT